MYINYLVSSIELFCYHRLSINAEQEKEPAHLHHFHPHQKLTLTPALNPRT